MTKKLTLILLAAISLMFVSCGDDKDDNYKSSDLVGEWYLTHIKEHNFYEGNPVVFEASFTKTESMIFIEVESDGTGTLEYTISPMITYMYGFGWSMAGNNVALSIEIDGVQETASFMVRELNSKILELRMIGTDEEGPYEYNYTFTRI